MKSPNSKNDSKEEKVETIYGKPLEEVIERYGGPVPPIIKILTRQLRNCK